MNFSTRSELINLKDEQWLRRQKVAGETVAAVLKRCGELINSESKLSLQYLNEEADFLIRSRDCTPTFLNYKGGGNIPFPGSVCTSVNENVVHGIPNDYVLKHGDLITIDLGATYEGAIADAAYTFVYGETAPIVVDMLKMCQGSLHAAIDAVKVGNRLGKVSHAIHSHVKNSSYGLIIQYGGHGIDYNKPHASPFVANKGRPDEGIRIQNGLAIAIEPMLTLLKDTSTKVLDDNWTVKASSLSCHFEHSVFVWKDEAIIITDHGMKYD